MAFWNDPSNLLVKQQHRWVVSFEAPEATEKGKEELTWLRNIQPWYIKSVDKPTYTAKPVQAKYLYSHNFNFPGRPVWNPIKITFYDIIDKQPAETSKYSCDWRTDNTGEFVPRDLIIPKQFTTQLLLNWLQTYFNGYNNPDEFDNKDLLVGFRDVPLKNNNPKYGQLQIKIKDLDTNGNVLETWTLYNAFLADVTYDKLDYSSDAPSTITANFYYDWAKLCVDSTMEPSASPPKPTVGIDKGEGKSGEDVKPEAKPSITPPQPAAAPAAAAAKKPAAKKPEAAKKSPTSPKTKIPSRPAPSSGGGRRLPRPIPVRIFDPFGGSRLKDPVSNEVFAVPGSNGRPLRDGPTTSLEEWPAQPPRPNTPAVQNPPLTETIAPPPRAQASLPNDDIFIQSPLAATEKGTLATLFELAKTSLKIGTFIK